MSTLGRISTLGRLPVDGAEFDVRNLGAIRRASVILSAPEVPVTTTCIAGAFDRFARYLVSTSTFPHDLTPRATVDG
jgi:hypothetical protein